MGGSTDFPEWYRENGGAVLSSSINKYCYIACRYLPPFFTYKYRIRYRMKEEVSEISEIQHPTVRECLKFLGIDKGIEMVHTSDLPALSGIGSSSAFTVGFLNALNALKGKMVDKMKLALDAIHIEQDMVGENVGSQDQVISSYGGFNKIEFGKGDTITVHPISIGKEKLSFLEKRLMLFFTGFSRISSDIQKVHIERISYNAKTLDLMKDMVEEGIKILNKDLGSMNEFGKLLHEGWQFKRSLSDKVSNDKIDEIYDAGIKAGAIGGKLNGAGGGGFMLFYVEPECQDRVRESLKDYLYVPIKFESLGSHIALCDYSGD